MPSDWTGLEVAGWRLTRPLETSSSEVYLAQDATRDRLAVVKIVRDETARARYERALALLAGLEHPHLLPIVAVQHVDSALCVVTPYVRGGDLKSLIEHDGPLALTLVSRIVGQIAGTLDALHERGIVHRDVKPANILLGDMDHAYLADVGLARSFTAGTDITREGEWVGTPDYAAPEQITGVQVDGRADVYALGAVAFECISGRVLFPEASAYAVLSAHVSKPPPQLAELNPGLPWLASKAYYDHVLARALAKEPSDRFATCRELAEALRGSEDIAGMSVRAAAADPAIEDIDDALEDIDDALEDIDETGLGTAPTARPDWASATRPAAAPPPPPDRAPLEAGAPSAVGRRKRWRPGRRKRPESAAAPASGAPGATPAAPPLARSPAPSVASPARPDWASATPPPAAPPGPRPEWASRTHAALPDPVPADAAARLAAGAQAGEGPPVAEGEMVDCTVFGPVSVARASTALVQVFVHAPEQAADVAALATEFDLETRRRGFRSLACPLEEGDLLGVELTMPGVPIDDPVQSLRWNRRAEAVQFGIEVPANFPRRSVIGTVAVSRDGIPIGHVKFNVSVALGSGDAEREPVPRGDEARRYRQAFVSYASPDRAEVLRRVQLLTAVGIGWFQDVLDLEPGERWEKQLYRHIAEADLFLLFWSHAAQQSEWVRREVDHALERKHDDELAPPEIRPVIIEGPPVAAPWPELAHLHFNDRAIYVLASADSAKPQTSATQPSPLPRSAGLALRLGDGPPIPLVGAGLLIGRAEDCELVLRDPQVSRLHARLLPLGADAVTVEDLGSSNGTFVNDTRVAGPMRIGAGDRLRLGSTVIMVIGSKREAGATR